MTKLACNRCDHTWRPFVKSPKRCPKCKSQYWNRPRVYRLKARPEIKPTEKRRSRANVSNP